MWNRSAAPRVPAPVTGYCWPLPPQETNNQRQMWLSLSGVSGSLCAQGFVRALRASLVGIGFDSKHDFTPPIMLGLVLLGLLLSPWTWGIFFLWDSTFSCRWLFSASCNFEVLAGKDAYTSFYSAILITLENTMNSMKRLPWKQIQKQQTSWHW